MEHPEAAAGIGGYRQSGISERTAAEADPPTGMSHSWILNWGRFEARGDATPNEVNAPTWMKASADRGAEQVPDEVGQC